MTSHDLAKNIAELMVEKQGDEVVILDLRELSSIADFFVICTGAVDVHIKAIVDNIDNSLRKHEEEARRPHHIEGYSNLFWVLMDYGDVVVHVFHPQAREYYKIERLWGDAAIEYPANIN